MQRTDRRYKILFDSHGIVESLVGFACARLELGEPDLTSVAALPTVRDVDVWGQLLETVQDQCWRFRTREEDGVLLACEIQSGREYLMLVRLLAYACVTLVSLDRREHFSSRRPPPLPCLFLVYTGATPWTPPSLSALTRGYVSAPGPLFPYIYMDVLHDDFSDWGLPRELDLVVRAERTRFPGDYLASGFPEGVRGLEDPHTVRALVEFMKLTMRGWSEQSAGTVSLSLILVRDPGEARAIANRFAAMNPQGILVVDCLPAPCTRHPVGAGVDPGRAVAGSRLRFRVRERRCGGRRGLIGRTGRRSCKLQ